MTYKVIASGSEGNSVLYHDHILVDIGVPFASLKPHLYKIQLVLLTHQHGDHLNLDTLRRLCAERPTVRVGCGEWMFQYLAGIRNIDVLKIGVEYDYTHFTLTPVKLYHDVDNCGYKIFRNGYKIFHATDTAHLNGIQARGYDLYAIEHSYDEDVIGKIIADKEAAGQFSYERGAINSHLSEQAARQFIFNNAGESYEVLRLHESRREYSKI